MKKEASMLRLRPYNKNDAEIIMSWIKDERAFYKWTAGVLGEYPISDEQFNTVSNLMAFTAIDDNDVVGFFTMRRPNEFFNEFRFGFVIVVWFFGGGGFGFFGSPPNPPNPPAPTRPPTPMVHPS